MSGNQKFDQKMLFEKTKKHMFAVDFSLDRFGFVFLWDLFLVVLDLKIKFCISKSSPGTPHMSENQKKIMCPAPKTEDNNSSTVHFEYARLHTEKIDKGRILHGLRPIRRAFLEILPLYKFNQKSISGIEKLRKS